MELKVLTQYQITLRGEEFDLIMKQMRKTAGNRKESVEDRRLAEEILSHLVGGAYPIEQPINPIRETDPEALEEQYGKQEDHDE